MKIWWVRGADLYNPMRDGSAGENVVRLCEAQAEIEKVRREGWLTTKQAEEEIAKARADGRESILLQVKEEIAKWRNGEFYHLEEVIDRIRSRSGDSGQKPLGDEPSWKQLVDAVVDLQRRMNEISPGNRP